MKVINSGHPQQVTRTVRVKATSTDPVKHRIWTARLRIDRAVIFQASGPKAFKAAVLIVVAEEASAAAIASVAADLGDLVVAIALMVADLVVTASGGEDSVGVALEGLAAAVSEADDEK